MAVNVIRFASGDRTGWGVVDAEDGTRARPVVGEHRTTGDFIAHAATAVRQGTAALEDPVPIDELDLLCPITENQQFICQAINYRSHMKESGLDPESSPFNIFFRKASSCLAPADTDIVKPQHVEFLDYELEIGLVLSKDVVGPVGVDAGDLASHVAALVMVNDVSARDVQLPELQFYKGKSYRTFGPAGPYLTLVDEDDLARFAELRLRLAVNGEVRQDAFASDMIHTPAPTLTELSGVQNWSPGDIVATGTPGGCALQAPPKPLAMVAQMVSAKRRADLIRRAAARNDQRLQPGDRIEATVASADGRVDLGTQACSVVGDTRAASRSRRHPEGA